MLSSVILEKPWYRRGKNQKDFKTTAIGTVHKAPVHIRKEISENPNFDKKEVLQNIDRQPVGRVMYKELRPLLFGRKEFDKRVAKPSINVQLIPDTNPALQPKTRFSNPYLGVKELEEKFTKDFVKKNSR